MDAIKAVWSRGEEHVKGKRHHEALLDFTRSKALLMLESKILYDRKDKNDTRAGKLLGEIMVKLNESIDKSVGILRANPVLCLNLLRGFSKADVKKAYRKCALKYHPDKNPDCDSACIFQAVQAAYEKLSASAPEAVTSSAAAADAGPTSSRQGRRHFKPASNSSDQQQERARAAAAAYGAPPKPAPGRGKAQQEQAPPQPAFAQRGPSDVHKLSTEELRKLLFDFGFIGMEAAGREELVKKYLAVQAHLTADQRRAKGKATNKSQRDRKTAQSEAAENWAKEMRQEQERMRQMAQERGRRQDFKMQQEAAEQREQERNMSTADKRKRAYDLAYGPGSQPKTGPTNKPKAKASGLGRRADRAGHVKLSPRGVGVAAANRQREDRSDHGSVASSGQDEPGYVFAHGRPRSAGGNGGDRNSNTNTNTNSGSPENRSKDADAARKNRVEKLAEELPSKSVAELTRMIDMSGLSHADCLEKKDLLEKLYSHFGMVDHVRHQERMAAARAAAAAEEDDDDGDYRERAKSDFANLREGFDFKMDIEALREAISGAGNNGGGGSGGGSAKEDEGKHKAKVSITRNKLEALEKKMFGVREAAARPPVGVQMREGTGGENIFFTGARDEEAVPAGVEPPVARPGAASQRGRAARQTRAAAAAVAAPPTDPSHGAQPPLNASWPEWMGVGLLDESNDSDVESPDDAPSTEPVVPVAPTERKKMVPPTGAPTRLMQPPTGKSNMATFKLPDFEQLDHKSRGRRARPQQQQQQQQKDEVEDDEFDRGLMDRFKPFLFEGMPEPMAIPVPVSMSSPEAPEATIHPDSRNTSPSTSPSTNTKSPGENERGADLDRDLDRDVGLDLAQVRIPGIPRGVRFTTGGLGAAGDEAAAGGDNDDDDDDDDAVRSTPPSRLSPLSPLSPVPVVRVSPKKSPTKSPVRVPAVSGTKGRPIGVVPVVGLSKVRMATFGLISDSDDDESDGSSDESIDPSDLLYRPGAYGQRFNSLPAQSVQNPGGVTPTAWSAVTEAFDKDERMDRSWYWGEKEEE
jgi:curved DNA-binding protein CbpA